MRNWLIIILSLIGALIGPIAFIWSVNTLFPVAAIPYTFNTWIAALCVGGIFYKS